MKNKLITNVIRLKKVDSTNSYAKRIISEKTIKEGTVIISDFQSSGRGQSKSKWESKSGENLIFSIILKPGFLAPEKQFILNELIALSLIDYLSELIPEQRVQIKWPNDIYVENNKIAGILIESIIKGVEIEYSTVGIGMNINQITFSDNIPNPISLKALTNREFDIDECLNNLCNKLSERYNQLKKEDFLKINSDYINSLYRFNTIAEYIISNTILKARIIGISEYGKLILLTENQKEIECDLKELEFII